MAKRKPQTLSKQIEAMKAEWANVAKRLHALQDRQHAEEVVPEMQKRIGQCFRYDNTDGTDRWPLYRRIVGIRDDRYVVLDVQKRPSGRVEIEMDADWGGGELPGMRSEYQPIDAAEFNKAVFAILGDVGVAATR